MLGMNFPTYPGENSDPSFKGQGLFLLLLFFLALYIMICTDNVTFDRKLDIHPRLEMGSQAAVQLQTQVS